MNKLRLSSLDGLRGLAIIAVILTHIPNEIWFTTLSITWHPMLTLLFGSGKTGVTILFLLTGFLMAWLYPTTPSIVHFWAKRYARLFPPFLVMVMSLVIIRSTEGTLPIWVQAGIILLIAAIGKGLWGYGIDKSHRKPGYGKKLFYGFFIFQICTAIGYLLLTTIVPPAVFYNVWSTLAQSAVTGLVNATLTLPLGRYIAQLDGVYWSLITETTFYLLYPILFVPVITLLKQRKSVWMTVLFIMSVIPFSFGLKSAGDRVLGIGMVMPHFLMYFVVGAALGASLPWLQKMTAKLPAVCFHFCKAPCILHM